MKQKILDPIIAAKRDDPETGSFAEWLAEYLVANGVTVQPLLPVEQRLPDTVPCSAGTEYSEAVSVLADGRKVLAAIRNRERFLCDADYWEAWGEKKSRIGHLYFCPSLNLPERM